MSSSEFESSLNKLSIDRSNQKASSSKKKQPIVDSWEDEDLSSGEETDKALSPQQSSDFPNAPPPTPISPTTSYNNPEAFSNPYGYSLDGASDVKQERTSSRPEKTDAVARRLIAGALGVRTPKKTEEQRAYDRAIREKEMKRRNEEKQAVARAQEEADRAKAAVWED
ncbi:hypothetical protein B7463_g6335, partial [Scytalidium lignicola]